MMLDQQQGRLWTAHGKALGSEVATAIAWVRPRLASARWRSFAELLAVTTVFTSSLGLASLIALQFSGVVMLA